MAFRNKYILNIILLVLYFILYNKAIASVVGAEAILSKSKILKSSKFHGANIDLSVSLGETKDVLALVQGPIKSYKVWKKEEHYGVWLNTQHYTIPFFPSYFYAISTKQDLLVDLLREGTLNTPIAELVPDFFDMQPGHDKGKEFRLAFINRMQAIGHFPKEASALFKKCDKNKLCAIIPIPKNALAGKYKVNLYFIENRKVEHVKQMEFNLTKSGLSKSVERLEYSHPILYSLVAIIVAIVSGALAALIFRHKKI